MLAPGPQAGRLGLGGQLGLLGTVEAGALRTIVRLAVAARATGTATTGSTGSTGTATATRAASSTGPTTAVTVTATGLALAPLGLLGVVPGRRGWRPDELDDVLRRLLRRGRQDGDDGDALHVVVGVGLDRVTDLDPGRQEGRVEHALGRLGPRGTPRERPVPAVTGELDIDPSGHTADHRIGAPTLRPCGNPGSSPAGATACSGRLALGPQQSLILVDTNQDNPPPVRLSLLASWATRGVGPRGRRGGR